jgi:hypothetical protein
MTFARMEIRSPWLMSRTLEFDQVMASQLAVGPEVK